MKIRRAPFYVGLYGSRVFFDVVQHPSKTAWAVTFALTLIMELIFRVFGRD